MSFGLPAGFALHCLDDFFGREIRRKMEDPAARKLDVAYF